jgi:citrate lyase subunit alpha/citrate CoA-transferase
METKLLKNAAGRMVPIEINGNPAIPFQGVGKYIPGGNRFAPKTASSANYPLDGNKQIASLKEALQLAGLKDGMTISTHHHFRDGDLVSNMVFDTIKELGVKNIRWFPSASFPCHTHLIQYLEDGTISHIEGSMNGPLGRYCSQGKMGKMAVLRSHGGRYQAIQDGEVKIDIAVIGAATADPFGNANGVLGHSVSGGLGFALADSQYAEKVIVVTDNMIQFPCIPWQIQGNYVDYTVVVDKIGIPEKIVSGTTELTKSPDRLLIAELTARFCELTGIISEGFAFILQRSCGARGLKHDLHAEAAINTLSKCWRRGWLNTSSTVKHLTSTVSVRCATTQSMFRQVLLPVITTTVKEISQEWSMWLFLVLPKWT